VEKACEGASRRDQQDAGKRDFTDDEKRAESMKVPAFVEPRLELARPARKFAEAMRSRARGRRGLQRRR